MIGLGLARQPLAGEIAIRTRFYALMIGLGLARGRKEVGPSPHSFYALMIGLGLARKNIIVCAARNRFLCPHDRAGVSEPMKRAKLASHMRFYALMIGLGLARPLDPTGGQYPELFLCPHDRAGVSEPHLKCHPTCGSAFLCPHDRAGVSEESLQGGKLRGKGFYALMIGLGLARVSFDSLTDAVQVSMPS